MDDLISRQLAIVQLSHNKTGDDDCDVVIQNDIETIKSLPSAQSEIIMCKDCEHYDDGLCRRWKYPHATAKGGFCSGADMRGEEDGKIS